MGDVVLAGMLNELATENTENTEGEKSWTEVSATQSPESAIASRELLLNLVFLCVLGVLCGQFIRNMKRHDR